MPATNLYVLDTHVLIWYFIGSPRLPQRLKHEIDAVRRQGGRLLVPTIVLAEALDLAEKERVTFDFVRLYQLLQQEAEFEIVGFGTDILDEAIRIRAVPDIHDRIIVATARFFGAGVLTKDRLIAASGEVDTV
jgi:PIN domain nuclease of toxin-antitoxin system